MTMTYFVSSCQQVVGHLLQVGSFPCVDESHHLLKHVWLHITDVHTVLRQDNSVFEIPVPTMWSKAVVSLISGTVIPGQIKDVNKTRPTFLLSSISCSNMALKTGDLAVDQRQQQQ